MPLALPSPSPSRHTSGTELLFHVTVLSNLARAYDKYSQSYDKSRIPESTFPDRFFLLRWSELSIGIAKASRLLQKTGLAGERLIALSTRVRSQDLEPNTRTGLGRFVERGSVTVDAVYFVDAAGNLEPVVLEEAIAASYRISRGALASFDELRPRSVSLLPVARACQARCPFCFSKASVSSDVAAVAPDWSRLSEVLRAARARGAERAVITGGGEPSLVGDEALERLVAMSAAEFSKVVLITNGARWGRAEEKEREEKIRRLDAAGLSVLAVSRHHFDGERNRELMGLDTRSELVARSVAELGRSGLALRLRWICVLQQGGIDSERALERYIDWAAETGAGEICFKELYVSSSVESVYYDREANRWSREHQVSLRLVTDFMANAGFEVAERLPWGAPIFEGAWNGRRLRIAAYTEPSLSWELRNGLCRSWNLMADGRCLASLEDSGSEVVPKDRPDLK